MIHGPTVRFVIALAAVFGTADVRAQAPEPDVLLLRLSRPAGGRLSAALERNLTNSPGYDNQPAWSPDGSLVYFTSVRADGQADIYAVPPTGGTPHRVTETAPESEYSATPIPGARAISVIRVERDSTQRLWRIDLQGAPDRVILENVKPVGYHTWITDTSLALFVLGSPITLQIASTVSGSSDTVASNVGRSLHMREGRVSFVQKVSRTEWWLAVMDPITHQVTRVVRMPPGVEDYDWTPQGEVLVGDGSVLKSFDPAVGGGWRTVVDLKDQGISGITRLAVSPAGDAVAIVGVPSGR